jgi:hypothetical protein
MDIEDSHPHFAITKDETAFDAEQPNRRWNTAKSNAKYGIPH